MQEIIALLTMLIVGYAPAGAEYSATVADTTILFDFSSEADGNWQILNDGVMGGRSKGYVLIEAGIMRFSGNTVTDGGGFTSVRTPVDLNLEEFDGLELRVRGSGRSFEIELGDGNRQWGRRISRRASFPTSSSWDTVRIPFGELRATFFGRPVTAPSIDLSSLLSLGVYIVDGEDGPFWIEVESIGVYSDNG
jgi:hypothetical protein